MLGPSSDSDMLKCSHAHSQFCKSRMTYRELAPASDPYSFCAVGVYKCSGHYPLSLFTRGRQANVGTETWESHTKKHYGTENFRAVESQHRPDLWSKEIFFCQVGIIDKTAAFVTCPTHRLLVQHECCRSETQRKAFHTVHNVGLLSSATSCNLQLKWRAAHNCIYGFPIQLKDFRIPLAPDVG